MGLGWSILFYCLMNGVYRNDSAGIYGVGKAAIHQPALAVLSHTPLGATETICWAGKGIVYTTPVVSLSNQRSVLG